MSVQTRGSLREPGAVLLVSCYELGHQPLGIAMSQAFLERAGFTPVGHDLALAALDEDRVRAARFVAISVPMHTALRLGIAAAHRIREIAPECHICFHGHYALLHADMLLESVADSTLGGEVEAEIVRLVEDLEAGYAVATGDARMRKPHLGKLDFTAPQRNTLPDIARYAHLDRDGSHHVAGHVEATRGCLHHCRHCPIPAVYGGRFFAVPRDVVLEDVRNQVAAGAKHITFGDADFLNAPTHSLRLVRSLHDEFPDLTFDFTAKIEHILEHGDIVPELAHCGAIFAVTAVESLSDRVLSILDKGHTRAGFVEAVGLCQDVGLQLNPTFVTFTPWITAEGYAELLETLLDLDLVDYVAPIQYAIRLLIPGSSKLLELREVRALVGEFDQTRLYYPWTHPDPRVDELYGSVMETIQTSQAEKESRREIFGKVWQQASDAYRDGMMTRFKVAGLDHGVPPITVPQLSEPWYC